MSERLTAEEETRIRRCLEQYYTHIHELIQEVGRLEAENARLMMACREVCEWLDSHGVVAVRENARLRDLLEEYAPHVRIDAPPSEKE